MAPASTTSRVPTLASSWGYLRADAVLGSSSDFDAPSSGAPGAQNRLSNYYETLARQDLKIDTRTATEYGVVRTFYEGVFTWRTGTYSGAGTTGVNGATSYTTSTAARVAGGSLGVYYAFIQFAGFTLGKAESQFRTPWAQYPANNFELPGSGWDPVNQSPIPLTSVKGLRLRSRPKIRSKITRQTSGT